MARKKTTVAAPDPGLDPERAARLRELVEEIEGTKGAQFAVTAQLISDLIEYHGAEIDDDAPVARFTMEWISACGLEGVSHAMRNWANAARRALLAAA